MSYLHFNNVSITSISAAIPKRIINNKDYTHFMSEQEVQTVIKMTGIEQRRFADDKICSSDLCYEAAIKLFNETDINKNDIDVLLFVSQTPDYRTPPTSMMLADKLGLKENLGAFDINLGCSGFIYGLQIAFLYASQSTINKVLLLNGETKSKAYSTKDKATSLLFGDAGSACIIEKSSFFNPTTFSMNSKGSGYKYIIMPGGGYRNPSSILTLKEKVFQDGSIRSDEQGYMDGEAVFNFTITDVPKDIKKTLEEAGMTWDNITFFVPHQANKFITNHIAKKFKIPGDKVLYSIEKYGNTSSVSIPLTLVDHFQNAILDENIIVLLSGFGVGLSWGTAITNLSGCKMCGIVEV